MPTPTLKYVAPTTPEAELTFAPEPVVIYGVPSGGGGGSTAWADITGKPTTFTPSAHTQAISTITGLEDALEDKANVVDVVDLANNMQTSLTAVSNVANAAVPNTRTVAGKALSADVTLVKGDVGLGNVDNTSDSAKPVSTATQTALNGKVSGLNGVTGLWKGTQAAYNALTPDANTVYIIQG